MDIEEGDARNRPLFNESIDEGKGSHHVFIWTLAQSLDSDQVVLNTDGRNTLGIKEGEATLGQTSSLHGQSV